jgi:hypothetical protein
VLQDESLGTTYAKMGAFSQRRKNVEQRNAHWMLDVGVGMIAALALWVTASSLLAWGTNKYNDIIYGNPHSCFFFQALIFMAFFQKGGAAR